MVSKILSVINVIQEVIGVKVTPEDADTIIERIEALQAKEAAQQNAHLTPEILASSQAVVNALALSKSDGDTPPAQAQVA